MSKNHEYEVLGPAVQLNPRRLCHRRQTSPKSVATTLCRSNCRTSSQPACLSAMGFKTAQQPIQTAEFLSYTIFRDMNIPMGTPNISQSISIGAPMPTPSNGGYNIEMKCQIRFELKDEIVQSVRYSGRAC